MFIWRAENASRRGSCTEHGEVVAGDHLGEDGADILTRAAAQGDGSADVAFYGEIAQCVHGAHRCIDAEGEPFRVDDGRVALDRAHERLRMRDIERAQQETIERDAAAPSPKVSNSMMVRLATRLLRVNRVRKTRVMLPQVE